MAVNKVIYGDKTLMDITDSTVTANKLLKGEVAYSANGEKIIGTLESGSAPVVPYTEVAYTEVGTHTFTVPNGVSKIQVAVIGGGGGYSKTQDILPSGASSFGNIVAMGGGNTYHNGTFKPVIAEPNGKTVDAKIDAVEASVPLYFDGAKGFNLDFTLDDGEYGAGGKCGFLFPMTMDKEQMEASGILLYGAFSGAKVIETLEVSAGEIYTVVVGGGGGITVTPQFLEQDNASSNVGGTKGNDGAVLVAFGGEASGDDGNTDEDLNQVLTEQETIIEELKTILQGKATGGATNNNYEKFIAKPTSTSVFTFDNPLGVTDVTIKVKRIGVYEGSSRKITKYIADGELGIGVMECVSSSDVVRYSSKIDNASVGNGEFAITSETIRLYQYSAANTWDTSAEYGILLFQTRRLDND